MQVTNNVYHFTLEFENTEYALRGDTWKPQEQWTEKESEDGFDEYKKLGELCSDITWEDIEWKECDFIWSLDIEMDKSETPFTIDIITAYLTAIEEWIKTNPTIIADRPSYIINQDCNPNYYNPKRCFGKIYAPDNIRNLLVKKSKKT